MIIRAALHSHVDFVYKGTIAILGRDTVALHDHQLSHTVTHADRLSFRSCPGDTTVVLGLAVVMQDKQPGGQEITLCAFKC